jgi:hypothetical protein
MLDESDYSETVGHNLLSTASSLAVCAGWLAFDAGDLPLSRRLYSEALQLAGSADDSALSAQVLQNLSMFSWYVARTRGGRGAARDALRFADQAAHAARQEPMRRLHTLIALRRASAISLLGDMTEFQRAISDARRELDRGISADDPEWIKFVGEAEITGHEVRGRACLGSTKSAIDAGQESLNDPHLAPRNRVCRHAQLAAILADSGDVPSAISEGMAVLPELERVTSVRTLGELRPVRIAAGKVAEEFCARYDAAEQALAAV